MTEPSNTIPIAEAAVSAVAIEDCAAGVVNWAPAKPFEPRQNPFLGFRGRPEAIVAYGLEDVVLDTATMTLLKDGLVVRETTYVLPDEAVAALKVDPARLERPNVDRLAALGHDPIHGNYFHWIAHAVPTVDSLAERHGRAGVTIALRDPPAAQAAAIRRLGHGAGPELRLDPRRQYFLPEVEYSTRLCGRGDFAVSLTAQAAYDRIVRRLPPAAGPRQAVYVSRLDAQQRPLRNEAALIEALRTRGFAIETLAHLSFDEQVARFRNAAIIIGPHGAGISNLVFARPDTVVYELFPAHFLNPCILALAMRREMPYWADAFPLMPDGYPPSDVHTLDFKRGWEVDVDLVLARVDELMPLSPLPPASSRRKNTTARPRRRRVLLGWEFGMGLHYVRNLAALVEKLTSRDFDCIVAARDVTRAVSLGRNAAVVQAPVWPGQHSDRAEAHFGEQVSAGDMLGALGLASPGAAAAIIGAWSALIEAFEPDVVLAEYAPGLLLAARGRVPSVATGFGGILPPDTLAEFPAGARAKRLHDEASLLGAVNAALAENGGPLLRRLPEIFAADAIVVGDHDFLDPYAAQRVLPTFSPLLRPLTARKADERRERVFAYLHYATQKDSAVVAALAGIRRPLTVYIPGIHAQYAAMFRARGIEVASEPVPFDRIAAEAAALIHAGGHGLLCQGLAIGLPQILLPDQGEQQRNADVLASRGSGIVLSRAGLTAPALQAAVDAAFDGGLRERALDEALTLAADPRPLWVDAAVEAIVHLAQTVASATEAEK